MDGPNKPCTKKQSFLTSKKLRCANPGNRYDESKCKSSFARELARALNTHRLTAYEVAKRMDILGVSVYRWLSGTNFPSHESMLTLCKLLPSFDLNVIKNDSEQTNFSKNKQK